MVYGYQHDCNQSQNSWTKQVTCWKVWLPFICGRKGIHNKRQMQASSIWNQAPGFVIQVGRQRPQLLYCLLSLSLELGGWLLYWLCTQRCCAFIAFFNSDVPSFVLARLSAMHNAGCFLIAEETGQARIGYLRTRVWVTGPRVRGNGHWALSSSSWFKNHASAGRTWHLFEISIQSCSQNHLKRTFWNDSSLVPQGIAKCYRYVWRNSQYVVVMDFLAKLRRSPLTHHTVIV